VPVRLKVDENLPDQLADVLTELGHDAVTVADQGWLGIADRDLWPGVQAEGRWLVTADKEFADLRRYPPGSHAGVILLRLAEQSRIDYLRLAETVVASLDLDDLAGAIVVVTDRGVRSRRAQTQR
jgi:predicted nuclease of predicted toxin-antitoxin system